jgi:putative ABC transport system ATP-binding protein
MKMLFRLAFKDGRHLYLVGIILISMLMLTFASQLEIVAYGVITKKGPDFFELFAPLSEGDLQKSTSVTLAEVKERWPLIDTKDLGAISLDEAATFVTKWKKSDFIARLTTFVEHYIPLTGHLQNLAYMLVLVALFKAVTMFVHRFATRLIAIRVSCALRQQYFEHIQSLPMAFFQKYNTGSLSSRVVGDAALVAEAVNACLTNYLQTPFLLVSTLTLCFLTSWQLTLLIFLGFPLLIFPIVFLARKVKKISKQIQQNQEHFASVLIDFLSGIQTVKVFAMENFSMKKYREHNEKMASLEQRSARYDLSTRPIVHTIAMLFLATAILYGLYVVQMGVSEVFVYCGFLYLFYEPIKKFAEENTHIQRGIAAAERIFEVMEANPRVEEEMGRMAMPAFNDKIEFKNVWFRYGEQWVLKGLNLTIGKGETVAIVGPTGAGKSTIVQLLPRLYDVEIGEILIDGLPLTTFTPKSIREQIAFVPQKPFLFLDTIAENISFGRPFTLEQVQKAAKKAHADEFIGRMAQGYDTMLAESGKNLSGGQQQRLAIARALVKEAPILVMDEATSSLDAVSENRIKSAIHELRGEATQIIIAHRLSTIEDADRIIYLEYGEKIAEGSKDELLKSCPGFRHMWEMLHKESRQS